jgi:hypothetical protein
VTGAQGSPPVVGLRVNQVDYWPGDTVVATPTYSDPDTRVEPPMESDGTGPLGEAVHIVEQRWHTDTPDAVWFWASAPDQVIGRGVLPLRMSAPVASDVLVLRVTDRQRLVGEARVPVVVAGLRLGVSVHADTAAEFTSELAVVAGGLQLGGMTKLFSSGSLPTPAKWPVPAGMLPVICFPDMPDEASFRARVATINRPTVLVLPPQEADRKIALAEYHRRLNLMAGWMDEAPDGVELVPNLTASWQESKNGNRYADWMPEHELIRTVAVDCYVGGQRKWRPLEAQLAPAAEAIRDAGREPAVFEWAVVVAPDATAEDRAARALWITASAATLRAYRVRKAAYWNSTTTNQVGSFRLVQGDPGWDALRTELVR